MDSSGPRRLAGGGITRRAFLQGGSAAAVAAAMAPGAAGAARPDAKPADKNVQWRNRQAGMSYRRLGRTGYMISEILCGGDPIRSKNYKHVRLAIDRGLNYLDMAPAYGRGDCEIAFGKVIAGSALRERVFLNTKISALLGLRNRLYRDVFRSLPEGKQEAVVRRAAEMRRQAGVDKPGYYLDYFSGQKRQFEPSYLSAAMARDYAHRADGSEAMRKCITDSIEGSLKRVGTDYFDLVMCPHGVNAPQEARVPEIFETFARLKKQGKVRCLAVSSHNDPAGVLRVAAETGKYDAVMVAYNVINGGYLEHAIRAAAAKDVGIIAMKAAMAVATHHKRLQPVPQWRIDKLNRIIPGDKKPPMKAYLWVLQNPHVAACVSNLWDEAFIRDNLSLPGKKVTLHPA